MVKQAGPKHAALEAARSHHTQADVRDKTLLQATLGLRVKDKATV